MGHQALGQEVFRGRMGLGDVLVKVVVDVIARRSCCIKRKVFVSKIDIDRQENQPSSNEALELRSSGKRSVVNAAKKFRPTIPSEAVA
jgi:hypothetical protein